MHALLASIKYIKGVWLNIGILMWSVPVSPEPRSNNPKRPTKSLQNDIIVQLISWLSFCV